MSYQQIKDACNRLNKRESDLTSREAFQSALMITNVLHASQNDLQTNLSDRLWKKVIRGQKLYAKDRQKS